MSSTIAVDINWLSSFQRGLATCLLLLSSTSFAQETASPKAQPVDPVEITIDKVSAAIKAIDASPELDDTEKAELKELYGQARSQLEKAADLQKQATQFEASTKNAANDIKQATIDKESLRSYDFQQAKDLDFNSLNKDRSELEQQVADAKKALAEAQAEPQRRVARMAAIAEELSAAQEALSETKESLSAIQVNEESSQALFARRDLLLATLQAQEATITKLENERNSYQAQGELPRLHVDLITAQLKQLEQDALKIVALVSERRATDATAQKEAAEEALKAAPAALKRFAQAVVNWANRRMELTTKIQEAARQRDATNKDLSRWQEEFERTKKRTEAVGSDTVGRMLLERRTALPSTTLLQHKIDEQTVALREYQYEFYELGDRRADLSDVNSAIEDALKTLQGDNQEIPPDAKMDLESFFKLETSALDGLLKDAERNFTLRIASLNDQKKLVVVLKDYSHFIDESVFWVRSAATLQPSDLLEPNDALAWLFNGSTFTGIGNQLKKQFAKHPFQWIIAACGIVLLVLIRPRLRRLLADFGEQASPISCQSIQPTLRAIWVTLLLAATGPLVIWGVSKLLHGASSEPVRAISQALAMTSVWLVSFELVRQLWRHNGLADAHFGWSDEARPAVMRFVKIHLILGTPLVFFATVFQLHGEAEFLASVGRISLIALLLLIAVTSFRLARSSNLFFDEQVFGVYAERYRRLLMPIAVIFPIVLAFMAARGYQYAAHQLTRNLLFSFSLVLSLAVLKAFLYRSVRITRRRLRKRQLLESRERAGETEESGVADIAAITAKEEETDLIEMDRQTRRLIQIAIFFIGVLSIWVIWFDVVQAANPILDWPVYNMKVAKDVSEPITVGAIFFAVLVLCIATAGWRNIPGLVDVFLLGRLGVESSVRYAFSTILQYGIAIVGTVVAAGSLGFTWDRMQWLVAAMSVGLGFGLQEVVANFVSGIILLFERPIRVGDIVTLGDTTGVVVRIRSRATTVRNWDRQEVVIPNKELITGRITNWTLSDEMNRIVINVGVAYGTDIDHARDLLHEVLADNPNVLDDPRPLVTFEHFGDSTLNFILRAYLESQENRLKTIHDLHARIYQRLNEEKIEIAFPQRDLHLRSIDDSIKLTPNDRGSNWSESELESRG